MALDNKNQVTYKLAQAHIKHTTKHLHATSRRHRARPAIYCAQRKRKLVLDSRKRKYHRAAAIIEPKYFLSSPRHQFLPATSQQSRNYILYIETKSNALELSLPQLHTRDSKVVISCVCKKSIYIYIHTHPSAYIKVAFRLIGPARDRAVSRECRAVSHAVYILYV